MDFYRRYAQWMRGLLRAIAIVWIVIGTLSVIAQFRFSPFRASSFFASLFLLTCGLWVIFGLMPRLIAASTDPPSRAEVSAAPGLTIKARLRVKPADKLPAGRAVTKNWGPVVALNGDLFAARILECSRPIGPGEAGEVVIAVMGATQLQQGCLVGAVFELREGPKTVIAEAEALEVRAT